MSSQESASLKTASRSLLVAAFVILIGIGAATAFSVGFTGSLEDSLSDPSSAPTVRMAALERLRDTLGYDGFLKSYRALMAGDTSAAPQLEHLARAADKALADFRAAGEDAHDAADAKSMVPLIAQFDRAAHNVAAGNEAPHLAQLEQTYAALKTRLASALEAARFRRVDTLSRTLNVAQTLAFVAMAALALILFGLAWFLRARLLEPLRTLRQSAERAADGGVFRQIWGIERRDEVGAVARAINRMRRQLASDSEVEGAPAVELRAVLDAKPYVPEYAGGVAAAAKGAGGPARSDPVDRLGLPRPDRKRFPGRRTRQPDRARSRRPCARRRRASGGAHRTHDRDHRFAGPRHARGPHRVGRAAERGDRAHGGIRSVVAQLSRLRPRAPASMAARAEAIATASRRTPRPSATIRRSDFAARFRNSATARNVPNANATPRSSGLASDLERLERLAANDAGLSADEAASLTASLIEAIDRLNVVVERVASSPNPRSRGRF